MSETPRVQILQPTTQEEREAACVQVNPLMEDTYGPGKNIKPSWFQLYEFAVLLFLSSREDPVAAALVENMGNKKWRTRFEAVDPRNRMCGMGRRLFQEIEKMVNMQEDNFPERNMEFEDEKIPPEESTIKLFAFVDKENMDTHGKFMEKLGYRQLSEDNVYDEDIECDDHEVAFCKQL